MMLPRILIYILFTRTRQLVFLSELTSILILPISWTLRCVDIWNDLRPMIWETLKKFLFVFPSEEETWDDKN